MRSRPSRHGAADLSRPLPVLPRERGYTFAFFAGDRGEPPHVHVRGNGGNAKVWIGGALGLQNVRGYDVTQQGTILKVVKEHRSDWLADWFRFFRDR